jgi:hypothetical protein
MTQNTAEHEELENLAAFRPNWRHRCTVCAAIPVVSATGLCGPCTWGESDTVGGAWWSKDDEMRFLELRNRRRMKIRERGKGKA